MALRIQAEAARAQGDHDLAFGKTAALVSGQARSALLGVRRLNNKQRRPPPAEPWAGGGSSGAGESAWHFRGKEIVRAVLEELISLHGMRSVQSFVLSGISAGGMATFNNADYVHEYLRIFAPDLRSYWAVPDSGWFQDVMPNQLCHDPLHYECQCAAGAAARQGKRN